MTAHTFRADSIASRVVAFFQNNPEEELGLDEIHDKFDAVRGNIHTLLAKAVEQKFLFRDRNKDGEWIYSAGFALTTKSDATGGVEIDTVHATHTKVVKAAKRSSTDFSAPRPAIDFDALKVDEDIAIPSRGSDGKGKWERLFVKMTKPGQSIALPAEVRGALGAAVGKYNRLKTFGTFRVAMVDSKTCRIFRTA